MSQQPRDLVTQITPSVAPQSPRPADLGLFKFAVETELPENKLDRLLRRLELQALVSSGTGLADFRTALDALAHSHGTDPRTVLRHARRLGARRKPQPGAPKHPDIVTQAGGWLLA